MFQDRHMGQGSIGVKVGLGNDRDLHTRLVELVELCWCVDCHYPQTEHPTSGFVFWFIHGRDEVHRRNPRTTATIHATRMSDIRDHMVTMSGVANTWT
jgi:hypothetical protein